MNGGRSTKAVRTGMDGNSVVATMSMRRSLPSGEGNADPPSGDIRAARIAASDRVSVQPLGHLPRHLTQPRLKPKYGTPPAQREHRIRQSDRRQRC